ERLAQMSDKAASTFTFALVSDSPTRIVKGIQNGRASKTVANAPTKPAVEPAKTVANAAPTKPTVEPAKADKTDKSDKTEMPDKSEAARQLLKQGRDAFKAGNLVLAKS